MIHERTQFEKILDKWYDYAQKEWDFWYKEGNSDMRLVYSGWETCITLIRHDLDELCEKEAGQMFEELKKREDFKRLSEIIET